MLNAELFPSISGVPTTILDNPRTIITVQRRVVVTIKWYSCNLALPLIEGTKKSRYSNANFKKSKSVFCGKENKNCLSWNVLEPGQRSRSAIRPQDGRRGGLRFNCWYGQEIFLFSKTFRLALGPTQPPVQWVTWTLSPGVKQAICAVDHLSHLVLWLKRSGSISVNPHAVIACIVTTYLMGCYGV